MSQTHSTHTPALAIRNATADDTAAVARLAALDSSSTPGGQLLLGTIDGVPAAAVSLTTGAVVADPFQKTAPLVALLRLRADHLHGPARGPDRSARRQLERFAIALRGRREAT
jgi:hypothetical protein